MKALLDNQFAPITYSWGFLESPFQVAMDETVAWRASLYSKIEVHPFEEPFADALRSLEPLVTPPRKELLLSTKSHWVAYFDNGINGGDPSSFVGYMAQRLKCRGLAVTCVPETLNSKDKKAKGTYGAVRFELYAAEPREWLNHERTITAMNDGGRWIFEVTGTVQPFEKVELYKAKRVKDRFTAETLEDYCQALGVRLFDPDFYRPSGVLIEICDPLPPSHIAITLAEARERLGLTP
jgi:hypothetical protein